MWARRHSRWPATLIVIFPPATCPNRSRKSCGLCFNAVRSLTYSMRAPASASAGSSAAPLSIPRTQDGIQVGLSKLLLSPVTLYLFGQFSRLTSDLQETLLSWVSWVLLACSSASFARKRYRSVLVTNLSHVRPLLSSNSVRRRRARAACPRGRSVNHCASSLWSEQEVGELAPGRDEPAVGFCGSGNRRPQPGEELGSQSGQAGADGRQAWPRPQVFQALNAVRENWFLCRVDHTAATLPALLEVSAGRRPAEPRPCISKV
jgi:hypothetical protein